MCQTFLWAHSSTKKIQSEKKSVHVSGLIKTHPASHASLTQAAGKIRAEGKGLPGTVSPPLLIRYPDKVPCWDVWALLRGVVLQGPYALVPHLFLQSPTQSPALLAGVHSWAQSHRVWWGTVTHKMRKLQGLVLHQSSPCSAKPRPEHGVSLLSQGLEGPSSTCRAL